jgi:hypothetical protein
MESNQIKIEMIDTTPNETHITNEISKQEDKEEINHQVNSKKRVSSKKFRKVCIKTEFIKWSLLTKFDCYSKIFQTENNCMIFIWLGIFLLFSSFTGYSVCKNIIDYYEYKVVTEIEIVHEKPTEFPVVTICNANPFTSQTAQDLISFIVKNYSFSNTNRCSNESHNLSQTIETFYDIYEITRMFVKRDDYGDKRRKKLTNGFFILNCLFNRQSCGEHNFTQYYSYLYGNCMEFNRNLLNIKQTITEGSYFGLSLIIRLDSNQTFLNVNPNLSGVGLKLFIHNKTFDKMLTEEINLGTGKEINVAISRIYNYKIAQPFSECENLDTFKSDYFNKFAKRNKTYRQYDCLKLCLQQMINDNCECHYTKLTKVEDLSPCSNLSQLFCIYTQQDAFTGDKVVECKKQCPLECNTVTYSFEMSSLEFPSYDLFRIFQNDCEDPVLNSMDFDTMKNSLISLKVYYPNTQYTEIREVQKTNLIDLISQIGGSLGMLLGFSIFHLIEIFEIVLLTITSLLNKSI